MMNCGKLFQVYIKSAKLFWQYFPVHKKNTVFRKKIIQNIKMQSIQKLFSTLVLLQKNEEKSFM